MMIVVRILIYLAAIAAVGFLTPVGWLAAIVGVTVVLGLIFALFSLVGSQRVGGVVLAVLILGIWFVVASGNKVSAMNSVSGVFSRPTLDASASTLLEESKAALEKSKAALEKSKEELRLAQEKLATAAKPEAVPTLRIATAEPTVPYVSYADRTATAQAATATPLATVSPVATPKPNSQTVAYKAPADAFVLRGENDVPIGVAYVLPSGAPYTITTPAWSTTVLAGGNYKVWVEKDMAAVFTADEVTGNVVSIVCRQDADCTNVVTEYTAGHFAVTTVFGGKETPNDVAFGAVTKMFDGQNCGSSGCNMVILTVLSSTPPRQVNKTFVRKAIPTSPDQMGIDPVEKMANVDATGLPKDASPIFDEGGKIIGHMYNQTGDKLSVGVPEGHWTILSCPAGCKVGSRDISKGSIVVLAGMVSDGTTPTDRNWTAVVNGDIKVVMIYDGNPISYFPIASAGLSADTKVTMITADGKVTTVALKDFKP